jgi:hypothetical protein
MLINIFGAWLIAANISFLMPSEKGCKILFNPNQFALISNKTCDEVAIEINNKIK